MVENEYADPESLALELQPLLEMWRERSLTLGRQPLPDDIVPVITRRWLRHIALIVPGTRAGFAIRTCGYDLIRRFGRLAEGHRVSKLAPGIGRPLGRTLRLVMKAREPVVWRPAVWLGRAPIHFSELILPLSEDAQTAGLLLLAAMEERRPRPKRQPEPDLRVADWDRD
jgi:hypothetical protein